MMEVGDENTWFTECLQIYVDFLFYFAIFESLETTLAAVTTVLPLL